MAEMHRLDERIAELTARREEVSKKHTELFVQAMDAAKSAEQLQDESTAELEASIRDIEETNRKVRANLEKARAEDEAALRAAVEQIREKRRREQEEQGDAGDEGDADGGHTDESAEADPGAPGDSNRSA